MGGGSVDILENEVVGVANGGSDNGDDSHEPVLEQTGQGRVERLAAGPETREGQDTLTTKLLDQTTLGEDDTQDVAKRGQRDKHGQGTLGALAKHVAEERGGHETLAGEDLLLGHTRKVRDVDEHVEDRDGADGERRGDLERADGVLGLAEGVVGVAVADIGPDDAVKRGDDTISAAGRALKGVGQVVGGVLEVDERRDDDDEHDDELDRA